ncbi:MAG: hypothetical protein ACHQVK_01430, partial [Candidatus Paceibacterales bacterium]
MIFGGSVYGFPKEQNIPILLYHHIQDLPLKASASLHRWSLSPKEFEAHMDWVAAHRFQTVTME